MEQQKKGIRDTSVLAVVKLSSNILAVYTMVVISLPKKFIGLFNLMHKEVVSKGVSRISRKAYGTVVSLVRDASNKAQMIHNQQIQKIETKKSLLTKSGHLYKKTEKLSPRRINQRRLLAGIEFSC